MKLTLEPWDTGALDEAISLLAHWQDFPTMGVKRWLWPLRTVAVGTQITLILYGKKPSEG